MAVVCQGFASRLPASVRKGNTLYLNDEIIPEHEGGLMVGRMIEKYSVV
jgi:hypothetical protein